MGYALWEHAIWLALADGYSQRLSLAPLFRHRATTTEANTAVQAGFECSARWILDHEYLRRGIYNGKKKFYDFLLLRAAISKNAPTESALIPPRLPSAMPRLDLQPELLSKRDWSFIEGATMPTDTAKAFLADVIKDLERLTGHTGMIGGDLALLAYLLDMWKQRTQAEGGY